MMKHFLKSLFGSRNERVISSYRRLLLRVNDYEDFCRGLSDDDFPNQTESLRSRHRSGETLDALLPEAFALCREASFRVLGMRHFDVQLIGGVALHEGKIAEMRTGEGKTLVATLPAYLNALSGQGVHIVTVNEYLAQRDANWMGSLYRFLGLTVGVTLSEMGLEEKKMAYRSDIVYGTNNEFGFDYLRDNMVYDVQARVQRSLHYAIVDEVDSILIDEARTPLIISGQSSDRTDLYTAMVSVVDNLSVQQGEGENLSGDIIIDEKTNQVLLTERGQEQAENFLVQAGLLPDGKSLYDSSFISLMHYLNAALRAKHLFHKDQHYVVQDNQIVIVDEFTGRLMAGRRWSEGLHQAIEAKEKLVVQNENQTLAAITFQNYFRLYTKLSGMTGTADTEAYEFHQIYGLETVVIPTHRPIRRDDRMDQIYLSADEKYQAILTDIQDCYKRKQPVLVGTTSIENSEHLSTLLRKEGLPHQVLNAKQHEREAEIVEQAGRPGMITIATNMAGRGTDIVLGGNIAHKWADFQNRSDWDDLKKEEERKKLNDAWKKDHDEVIDAGGLHIIGTERHESRRVDNQLRGRSGRQGDPGSSRFYLSLEDPLLRIFSGDRVQSIMKRLQVPTGEAIEHSMVSRALESAQRRVEARNFDIRKQLLEYDDVANEQRRIIYHQRNDILDGGAAEVIQNMRHGYLTDLFYSFIPPDSNETQWDWDGLQQAFVGLGWVGCIRSWFSEQETWTVKDLLENIQHRLDQLFCERFSTIPEEVRQDVERSLLLQSLDTHWRDLLLALDHLRQGIHLRGYAAKNPKQEYKREAFVLFDQMLQDVRRDVVQLLMKISVVSSDELSDEPPAEEVSSMGKVARNQVCPCGSGKKYKHCHGAII